MHVDVSCDEKPSSGRCAAPTLVLTQSLTTVTGLSPEQRPGGVASVSSAAMFGEQLRACNLATVSTLTLSAPQYPILVAVGNMSLVDQLGEKIPPTHGATTSVRYDLTRVTGPDIGASAEFSWELDTGTPTRSCAQTVAVSRYLGGHGEVRGSVRTSLRNTGSSPATVTIFDTLPWFMRLYIHTISLHIDGEPAALGVCC
mmetsp:Transcript_36397/g.78666  ORF Transcript_36397/g.78666 Transcript_36397/m.78666 type:complete len:200 (-) Transcript_36397:582-1181(-)